MNEETIILHAKDCLVLQNQKGHGDAIQYFISQSSKLTVFKFGQIDKDKEKVDILYFNTSDAKWYAGRLVGEANFVYNNVKYIIRIEPRFGNLHLFRMLEEVYNIRLTDSKSTFEKQLDYQLLIKRLIAFMWLSMLAKANKHGLPRVNVTKTHKGSTVKGRMNVRKSILPYVTESHLISEYKEKQTDQTVVRILNSAYDILSLDYDLAKIKQSSAAKNAIEQLKASAFTQKHISDYEYHSLSLKSIYTSYKSVLDLSWDIIKKKEFGNKDSLKDGQSFFIDMAELWEIYLRSILKKSFTSKGWIISSPKVQIYKDKDYKRSIIPDIVMQRSSKTIVFDAKYKRMDYRYFDYDRTDFFQIHTYMNYYQQRSNVIAGGLLYPLSLEFNQFKINTNHSDSLFNENNTNTKFIVDGIDFSEINEENIKLEEKKFLNRISLLTEL